MQRRNDAQRVEWPWGLFRPPYCGGGKGSLYCVRTQGHKGAHMEGYRIHSSRKITRITAIWEDDERAKEE